MPRSLCETKAHLRLSPERVSMQSLRTQCSDLSSPPPLHELFQAIKVTPDRKQQGKQEQGNAIVVWTIMHTQTRQMCALKNYSTSSGFQQGHALLGKHDGDVQAIVQHHGENSKVLRIIR